MSIDASDARKALSAATHAAQAIVAATNGDALGAAAHAIDAALELLPAGVDAHAMLDERARARAEAVRQLLNAEKFGA